MGACLPPKQLKRRRPEETKKFVVLLHKFHRRWKRLDCDCKRCLEFKRVLGTLQHIEGDEDCAFSCSIDYFMEEPANRHESTQQRNARARLLARQHGRMTGTSSSSSASQSASKENHAPQNKDGSLENNERSPKKAVPMSPKNRAPVSPKGAPPSIPNKVDQTVSMKYNHENPSRRMPFKEDLLSPSKGEVLWVRFIDTKSNCAYYRNSMTGQVT
mmetsp:Transcript_11589/g.22223  ORF Transcript_11589/g.22223 Transcript_11589/m.22223 type:complete len:215 (+) Transcript_11589:42-686(+)